MYGNIHKNNKFDFIDSEIRNWLNVTLANNMSQYNSNNNNLYYMVPARCMFYYKS